MDRGGTFIVNAGSRAAIVSALLLALSACGGGRGSGSQESPEPMMAKSGSATTEVALKNQMVRRPLSGARIEVFRLDNLDSAGETVMARSRSERLDVAGSFELALDALPTSGWGLVRATAGRDIDGDDGVVDDSAFGNQSGVHA